MGSDSEIMRIDKRLAADIRKIREQMNKDLGIKISTTQASFILKKEREELKLKKLNKSKVRF